MALADRQRLIRSLEDVRESRIITYITGDRPSGGLGLNLPLQVEQSVIPVLKDAIRAIGEQPRLDIFLYTRGGSVDTVWPIISFARQFTDDLSVVVPFRAHSAGTLLAMGADHVVLARAAELTSVDPTTGSAWNPQDELNKAARKGISVEDLTAYFDFARTKQGLTDPQHVMGVFAALTAQLHPLALGHVQRVHTQIRFLAGKLLASRRPPTEAAAREVIVRTLIEELYSHSHAVTREDARELLGEMVAFPDEREETAIWDLFSQCSNDLLLRQPHNLLTDMGGDQAKTLTYTRGYVETHDTSTLYETDVRVVLASKARNDVLYTQTAQQALASLSATQPGLPVYIPGLATDVMTEVLFEGWR